MVDVYIMRHGQTEANVEQILIGRGDSPFTAEGWQQPARVAEHLKQVSLSVIYSSPMDRALRTSELVLEAFGQPIRLETEVAIAEIDAGDFSGLSFEQIRQRVPDVRSLVEFPYPGGESWTDVQDRTLRFVWELESRHEDEAVLLVTHAGVISVLVAESLKQPVERYIQTRFGHDFLGHFEVKGASIVGYEKVAGTVDD